mmetsp:Transcript_25044/g.65104  ORF Transcript_25044/g.65104 Transcript_25044/m.65104 type:complete len:205 (+) Transcript_25044:1866-2480(+)
MPVNRPTYLIGRRGVDHLLTPQRAYTTPAPPGTSSAGTMRWLLFLPPLVSYRCPTLVARPTSRARRPARSPGPGRPVGRLLVLARPSLTVNGLLRIAHLTEPPSLHQLCTPASLLASTLIEPCPTNYRRRPARSPRRRCTPHTRRRIARLRTPRPRRLAVSHKRLARRPSIGWRPALSIARASRSDLTEPSFHEAVFDYYRFGR